jgi:hypothetical protein
MSNHLAIATATEAIAQIVRDAAGAVVPGTEVTTGSPDRAARDARTARVNVFLYQVAPNAALRNSDLPTRNADGALVRRAQAAVDLFYLVSFYGKDEHLVAQQLLALTVGALHGRAVIGPVDVARAIAAVPGNFLDGSDLAAARETLTLSSLSLSLEEMARLWSTMLQVPYALSVAYRCSVVLLDASELPGTPLPVRRVHATARPSAPPRIERLTVRDDGGARTLVVLGSGFGTDATLLLGTMPITPGAGSGATELFVPFTTPALRAGFTSVTVVTPMGRSAPQPCAIPPVIGACALTDARVDAAGRVSGTVTFDMAPGAAAGARVEVLLNPIAGGTSRTVARPGVATDGATHFVIAVAGLAPGSYFVRARVDDVESPLAVGVAQDGEVGYVGPMLAVRAP